MDSKYLIAVLDEKNINISELSRHTGVPKSTIHSWLKGRSPNLEQLNKVADFLNVTLDYLTSGKKLKSEALFYRMTLEGGAFEIIIKKLSED